MRVAFRWQKHPGGRPTPLLRMLATAALEQLGVREAEIGVLMCDDATIRALNRQYRHKDHATDVLSFEGGIAEPGGVDYLGDIAISIETAGRQAREGGVPLLEELQTLLLHALVHLQGYDHEVDGGEMDALEGELRRRLLR